MNGGNSSSSSSFELLNATGGSSGSGMSSGQSSPAAVAMSHVDVDAAVWLYMRRCAKYAEPLQQVDTTRSLRF